jgi:hypothetical protein
MWKLIVAVSIFAVTGSAGTISYSNTDFDLGGGWRTSSVAKPLDINGNNVLGSDGWYVAGGSGSSSYPSYIANVSLNPSIFSGNASYASIDDPTTTPGLNPTQIVSGTFNPGVGTGNPATLFSFQLTGGIPATIQIGLMVDNLDAPVFNSEAMELKQTNGTADVNIDTTGSPYNDSIPDWIFFDVTGAAGDEFSIVAYGSPSGPATLGAISFDSAPAPEPASGGLLLAALAVVFARRLRREA